MLKTIKAGDYILTRDKEIFRIVDVNTTDGLDNSCKGCRGIIQKEHYLKNKEKYLARSKEYHKKYDKLYTKNRRKVDINYKLANNLRKRLTSAIKQKVKNGSSVRDLGCSIEEFKIYIESLWQPGMTWANYGRGCGFWNLDHKIPISSFDLSNIEQLKQACHFSNQQPMWAVENSSKGKKIS